MRAREKKERKATLGKAAPRDKMWSFRKRVWGRTPSWAAQKPIWRGPGNRLSKECAGPLLDALDEHMAPKQEIAFARKKYWWKTWKFRGAPKPSNWGNLAVKCLTNSRIRDMLLLSLYFFSSSTSIQYLVPTQWMAISYVGVQITSKWGIGLPLPNPPRAARF